MDGKLACLEAEEIKALMAIWVRARIRAFAHDFAAKRLRDISQRRFACEVALTFLSIGLLITGYFAIQTFTETIGNVFFLASIMVSLFATYVMLTSHRIEIMGIQSRHKMMVRSFMQITQKARRMEAHVYDEHYYKYLISFLNDQMEGLVTTGEHPSHADYEKAQALHNYLKNHPDKDVSGSYTPGTEEEEAIANAPLESVCEDGEESDEQAASRSRRFVSRVAGGPPRLIAALWRVSLGRLFAGSAGREDLEPSD